MTETHELFQKLDEWDTFSPKSYSEAIAKRQSQIEIERKIRELIDVEIIKSKLKDEAPVVANLLKELEEWTSFVPSNTMGSIGKTTQIQNIKKEIRAHIDIENYRVLV